MAEKLFVFGLHHYIQLQPRRLMIMCQAHSTAVSSVTDRTSKQTVNRLREVKLCTTQADSYTNIKTTEGAAGNQEEGQHNREEMAYQEESLAA